jgi:sialate O-acetylesterase
MKKLIFLILTCVLLVSSVKGYAVLKLADALQDDMVLQQNKAFKVWGKANAGANVSISTDWMPHAITVIANADGSFMGTIDVPIAKKGDFTAHQLIVTSTSEKITLHNLLIGDLWFCSGQSNMQFAVKEMTGAEQTIKEANQPNIRLLKVDLNFSSTPIDGFSGKWQQCSTDVVKNFSAVGYIFGHKLYEELDIPIGLIFSGIGASAVQAYIPQQDLASNPLLDSVYLRPYLNSPKAKELINGGFSFEKVIRPFLLYNAMINPFVNLSVKGFCWYQGESNHMERGTYTTATQTMIKSWRTQFKQGDLPFYYVQIAPYGHEKADDKLAYDAFFREAQMKVAELNNTGIVATMDVGDAKDLHPKNKKPIGLRLAAVALNRTYARHDVLFEGPTFNYVEFKKREVIIHFKEGTLANGLSTKDGEAPRFFYTADESQIFYPAEAVIKNNTVVVTSKKVRRPKAVRYAFFNYPVTNLQNSEGFPALPFRTDSWQEVK